MIVQSKSVIAHILLALCFLGRPIASSLRADEVGAATAHPTVAAASEAAKPTPAELWQRLLDGNQRFVAGKPAHPDQTIERRNELAKGQAPFAIILTCSDSRVSPELYFDQGLGDLFVVRNAGNVLDDHVIGTIEYAVEHLHVGLLVVVGHAKCGAVAAAVAGGKVPGHVQSIVESIAPSVAEVQDKPGDKVENAVAANAEHGAALLKQCEPILGPAVRAGHLVVLSARYDLSSGKVEKLK